MIYPNLESVEEIVAPEQSTLPTEPSKQHSSTETPPLDHQVQVDHTAVHLPAHALDRMNWPSAEVDTKYAGDIFGKLRSIRTGVYEATDVAMRGAADEANGDTRTAGTWARTPI